MTVPYKRGKEAALIITAGMILAGSAAWHITDSREKREDIAVITRSGVTTAAASVQVTTARETAPAPTSQTATTFLMLDINSATAEELTQLNGIGEHLAAVIVDYRTQHGGFLNIEELMQVSGIGEATFADIRGHVFVADPIYTTAAQTEKPTIPDIEPTEEVETTEPPLTLEDVAPVDINTADAETLMLLPHVDEETAEETVELRVKLGHFSNTYELLYVKSLVQSDVADILEYVVAE